MTASFSVDEGPRAMPTPGNGSADGPGPGVRRAALLAVVALLALLLAGSAVGDDDAFPFGPFRMYSTANAPNGSIVSTTLEMQRSGSAEWVRVRDGDLGMRRAEYEGQWQRIVADPGLLGDLAHTVARRMPGIEQPGQLGVPIRMRLVRTTSHLKDRTVVDRTREVVASWERP